MLANGAVLYGWRRVYSFDEQGGRLGFSDEVEQESAAIVQGVVARLLGGETLRGITESLNQQSIPAPAQDSDVATERRVRAKRARCRTKPA